VKYGIEAKDGAGARRSQVELALEFGHASDIGGGGQLLGVWFY